MRRSISDDAVLPILVRSRPDVIFVENIIVAIFGHCVKHFRKPRKGINVILSNAKADGAVDERKDGSGAFSFLPVQVFRKQLLHSNRVQPLLFSSLGVSRNLLILLVELQVQADVRSLFPTGTANSEEGLKKDL